jgi:hypothetical protein
VQASNEIFSPSNKIIIALILLAALVYIIPTATNNKEINIHDTITENEITTTTTVIYNQITGTITTLDVLIYHTPPDSVQRTIVTEFTGTLNVKPPPPCTVAGIKTPIARNIRIACNDR